MPKAEPRKTWVANVGLEVSRLAFSIQYIDQGKGSNKKRVLVPTGWLNQDDKTTIMFDTGKRLKGWLKAQAMTLGGEMKRDTIAHGLVCKSLPAPGCQPVGSINDLETSKSWESFVHKDDYILNGLPAPEVEAILTTEGRSVFAMYVVLGKPVNVSAAVYCFARGFNSDQLKNWLEEIGQIQGVGDKHSSSDGFGSFTLKSFEVKTTKELLY